MNRVAAERIVGQQFVQRIKENDHLLAPLRNLARIAATNMQAKVAEVGRSIALALAAQQETFQRELAHLNWASWLQEIAERGPPANGTVLAAYGAWKALSKGDVGPMDRFLGEHLKLTATPENRRLLWNIIDASLARPTPHRSDRWLVLGKEWAPSLVEELDKSIKLFGDHKAALLAYGTSSDIKQRKLEELPWALYQAWSDIQRAKPSATLVDLVGNYLRAPLAGEPKLRTTQFEDIGQLEDAVSKLNQGEKVRDGSKLPLRDSEVREFELREFELRTAAQQEDVLALKQLVDEGVLRPNQVSAHLRTWAQKAGLSGREAQMCEADLRSSFDTAAAAREMGVPESKARDYRSRYLKKLRAVAGL